MGLNGDRERTICVPVFHGEAPERRSVRIDGLIMFVAVIMVHGETKAYGPFPSGDAARRWTRKHLGPEVAHAIAVVELSDPEDQP